MKLHKCYRCKQHKPATEFYTDKSRPQGICSSCKQYQFSKPGKPYSQRNVQAQIRQTREWERRNPDKARAMDRVAKMNRRARNMNGAHTADEWRLLCAQYGNVCLCCGSSAPLTVDHVIPLARGGTNTIDNIQPLCHACNTRKSTRTTDYRVGRQPLIEQLGLEL